MKNMKRLLLALLLTSCLSVVSAEEAGESESQQTSINGEVETAILLCMVVESDHDDRVETRYVSEETAQQNDLERLRTAIERPHTLSKQDMARIIMGHSNYDNREWDSSISSHIVKLKEILKLDESLFHESSSSSEDSKSQ